MKFRTVDGKPVNPITYTAKMIGGDPFIEVHIGTDSQRYGQEIIYVTAIAYRYPNNGVHYIYQKNSIPPTKDNWTRLWRETELSLGIANIISENMPSIKVEIDLDYNDDEFYFSNKLVSAAKGWVTSLGYKANIKPNKQIATRAADYHCK